MYKCGTYFKQSFIIQKQPRIYFRCGLCTTSIHRYAPIYVDTYCQLRMKNSNLASLHGITNSQSGEREDCCSLLICDAL